jgi:quercetin dioxygenase-like cupin family protein
MAEQRGEPDYLAVADLAALAGLTNDRIPVWTHESRDLDVNLIVFANGGGVGDHVNSEVDVLFIGVAGDGWVEIDGTRWTLGPLHAVIVPRGSRRSTGSSGHSERFAYLTCHRRRGGLWPQPPRSSQRP